MQIILCVAAFYVLWALLWKLFYLVFGTGTAGKVVKKVFDDGRSLFVVGSDLTTELIYKEIFVEQVYFKHGVSLDHRKEPLILDLGGHVGMFSTFIAESYPTSKVHVFEPVPLLAEAIEKNVAARPDAQVTVHKVAVGEKEGDISFEYNPRVSAGTSLFPDQAVPSYVDPVGFVRAAYGDAAAIGYFPKQPTLSLVRLLDIPYLQYVAFVTYIPLMVLHYLWEWAKTTKSLVRTRVAPLSLLLKEKGLHGKRIDLLKVDVEGAEWMVLMGLDQTTWNCVEQAVIEVHNCDDQRVKKVMELLKSQGFNAVDHPPDLDVSKFQELLDLHTIYATRPASLLD